jgi:peptidoglycan/xylan/chitin deacetylase (PgdA/CDA1 family)
VDGALPGFLALTQLKRDRIRATRSIPFAVLLHVIIALLLPDTLACADSPKRNPFFVQPSVSVTNKHICLSAVYGASDTPFGLAELEQFAPKWRIPPPVWGEYPAVLDDVPLVTRSYSPETVAYLAEHEIRYGDRAGSSVALTIDCEYSPEIAQHMLDTLRDEHVRVTFFLQGRFAYRNPEIVRQMAADGHELGSHSFFHPRFTELSELAMTQEITYTEAAIAWAVGEYVPMRFFRFPYGGQNRAAREHVSALGYQSCFWNLDPRGWDPSVSACDVVDAIEHQVHAGSIVIMHCSSWDDAQALPGVIRAIRERDLAPGKLSDVLRPEDRDVPGYQVLPAH